MKLMARLLLLLMVVAALAACQPTYVPAPIAPPSVDLAGSSWVLSSLNGALPLPGTTATLQFGTDGSASGTDGCNRFNRPFTQDGYTLSFGQPGVSTMMACADAVMAQATGFADALTRTDSFSVSGGLLTLRSGGSAVATFVAAAQDLADTSWQVTAYNNGREAVVSVLDGSELTAEFAGDGQVSGSAGCNQYFGSFTTGAGAIAIGPLGSTMRFCDSPPGVMEQEAEFLAALESAATFSIEGNDLQMRTAADQLAVMMTRRLVVDLPEPAPAVPWGRVVAPQGVNVRTGPGVNFPVIGVAQFGDEGEIVGRSADGGWWAAAVPAAPNGVGWVSADFVVATDAENVPVLEAPPPPVIVVPTVPAPPATATPLPPPTATPAAQMSFSANPTTINQGQCSTLAWSVENVQAVWVYPQGQPYNQFPRTGQGSEQVCPTTTTTYEMRVLLRNGTTAFSQVTITVNGAPATATPVPPPPAPADPLSGTRWDVISFNTGNAVVTPISGSFITADFANGQITGSSGCNTYTVGYQVNGNAISVGASSGGMMMCAEPAGIMEQEAQFLAALQSAATFRITGNTLELRTAGDQLAVSMNRAP